MLIKLIIGVVLFLRTCQCHDSESLKPKLHYCCPDGEFFRTKGCYKNLEKPAPHVVLPPIYSTLANKENTREIINNYSATHFDVIILEDVEKFDFYSLSDPLLLESGSLSVYRNKTGERFIMGYEKFCLANHAKGDFILGMTKVDGEGFEESDNCQKAKTIAQWVTLFFLVITFLMHLCLPQLRNFQGIFIMTYVFCLFMAFSIFTSMQYYMWDLTACVILGFAMYFFFLTSFSWLNVINFDMFWALRGTTAAYNSMFHDKSVKLMFYSAYAFIFPLILTGFCYAVEFTPTLSKYIVKPDFGVRNCWFASADATLTYFYGPMSFFIICNIFLFITAIIKIQEHKKQNSNREEFGNSKNGQRFDIYFKLFIVTGISWSFEVISFVFDNEPWYIWIVPDLFNGLQGLWIFLVIVSNRKVRQSLLEKSQNTKSAQVDSCATTLNSDP